MEELIQELGENCIAVITYGKKHLVVVEHARMPTLNIVASHLKDALVLRKKDIDDGLDVFPLDFLNILTDMKVLHGEDPFKSAKISKTDIRSQLEFDLRSKLIRLRTKYLQDPKRSPQEIVHYTIDTLNPLLKGLCALKLKRLRDVPAAVPDMLAMIEEEYGFDLAVLQKIYKKRTFGRDEAKGIVEELIVLLTQMADGVDTIQT